MKSIERAKLALKSPIVKGIILVLVVLLVAVIIRNARQGTEEIQVESQKTVVELASAATIAGGDSLSLIGTVRAFTEAQVTAERAGRVTSVNTTLGGRVGAGQILATLENAAESASVLQAQGAYEAALAAASQTRTSATIGVGESQTAILAAQNNLVSAIRSSYNTTNATVLNDIDDFFGNPSNSVPGLKLDGRGRTQELNTTRVSYQTLLPSWQQRVNGLSASSNLQAELQFSKDAVNKTISFLDAFITLFGLQGSGSQYSESEIQTFVGQFTAQRSSLLATLASLEAADTGIKNAKDAANRAQVSATGGSASAADAQVKQALGSLRAAQANYAKTILRTPISGTVNSLDIKTGDFLGGQTTIAVVANNNALEIVTFVGDNERDQLVVGEEVLIEGKYKGIITQIAPAVDTATRKTEVRIATDNTEISNGDTVRITKEVAETVVVTSVRIPLTAVKFEAEDGFVLQVENGKLVEKKVELGNIRGNTVEIVSGLDVSEEFVLDARGLTVGTEVEIKL